MTGAVELRELACEGSGLVGSMLERPWAEPAADAPWHAPHAVRRTALKKPPARPSRLLSALSFRSTPATTAPSVGSAASSRKSYRG